MIRTSTALILLCLWMAARPVFGQDGTYRLQVDDIISIRVYNEPQIQAAVTVGRDGNISAPFVGIIRALGKTTSELEEELRQEFIRKLRIRDPRVSVAIERFRPMVVFASGAFRSPGKFEYRPGDTILNLLTMAGGYVIGQSDIRRARLRRAGMNEWIPIDLHAMLILGDTSQNFELRDGDDLHIPEDNRNKVLVFGEIPRPGVYPYREPMDIAEVLALAGHRIPNRSKLSEILVARPLPGLPGQYQRFRVNFVRFETQGDATQNILMQPGDIVIVPSTKTPNINEIAGTLNSVLFLDTLLRRGIFGVRIPGL